MHRTTDPFFDALIGLADPVTEAAEAIAAPVRLAKCVYGCGKEAPSSDKLAFFKSTPDKSADEFYCGCFGWE